jgi:hypothetical protein
MKQVLVSYVEGIFCHPITQKMDEVRFFLKLLNSLSLEVKKSEKHAPQSFNLIDGTVSGQYFCSFLYCLLKSLSTYFVTSQRALVRKRLGC